MRSSSEKFALESERNAIMRLQVAEDRNRALTEEVDALKARKSFNWNLFVPVFVAVIGATASILGTAYSQFQQAQLRSVEAENARELQDLIAQQELIKLAVSADEERADANVQFLVSSDLVPNYAPGLKRAIAAGQSLSAPPPQPAAVVPSKRSPTGGYYRNRAVERITIHDTGAENVIRPNLEAYNYIIDLDGEVIEGIPEGNAPVCVRQLNQGTLCIALVGRCWESPITRPITPAQQASLEKLVREKMDAYGLTPDDVYTRQNVLVALGRPEGPPKCARLEAGIDEFRARLAE